MMDEERSTFTRADNNISDCYVALLSNGTGRDSIPAGLFNRFKNSVNALFSKNTLFIINLILIILILYFTSALYSNKSLLQTVLQDESYSNKYHLINLYNQDEQTTTETLNSVEVTTLFYYFNEFENFTKVHKKVYTTEEEKLHRFKIFIKNKQKIHEHNTQKQHKYTLRMNQFGDLTQQEFRQFYLGYKPRSFFKNQNKLHFYNQAFMEENPYMKNLTTLPESVDWVKQGCVSEVKNQGKCGSCWAFSASGAVESAYCAKYGTLPDLSEQQLIDCARREGNHGCNGGGMDQAFTYMIREKGLCTEKAYPYRGKVEKCNAKNCEAQVQVVRFIDIPHKNELALMAAIAHHGPVSVGVESDDWQFYYRGIYDKPCGKNLDHGVLVVGYGYENFTQYWLIKNSWGSTWGNHGYIKLLKHDTKKSGECGILLEPSYPVVF